MQQVIAAEKGMQQLTMLMEDGASARAVHYTDVMPEAKPGDKLLLNVTAVELGLGTGGVHFVAGFADGAELLRMPKSEATSIDGDCPATDAIRSLGDTGHIMKLRYTPLQRSVVSVEAPESPYHGLFRQSLDLAGTPVLIGELHSMLPAAVCRIRALQPEASVAYVMTDGGALPAAFSRHVAALRGLGWLRGTVTCGHAYGGDLEALNKFSALLAAKHVLGADIVIAAMGPGIAGTGTEFGHTGMETAELINAAAGLSGTPVVMPRITAADPRARHQGASHHLRTVLTKAALQSAAVPLPGGLPASAQERLERELGVSAHAHVRHTFPRMPHISQEEIRLNQADYPVPITTMGRELENDVIFFEAVCCAADYACGLLRRNPNPHGPTG
ncbi:DUF3866 family protein [Paenibacillus swuensis]|uniref:DUF3866 family protein n=1 Tax=Paenibacillus swuensis TaxID=1178515 RepID=UPI0018D37A15|nr:DUF3866 family protein [Paenibacillus swuensis]